MDVHVKGHFSCFQFEMIINSDTVNRLLFEHEISSLYLLKYLEMGFLDNMDCECFNFRKLLLNFPRVVMAFYIPITSI